MSLKLAGEDNITEYLNLPHFIKYMGSKKWLLDVISHNLIELYKGETICDLFSGTSLLAGKLRKIAPIFSNDIQNYSFVLAKTYLSDFTKFLKNKEEILTQIHDIASNHVQILQDNTPLQKNYLFSTSLNEFALTEKKQQKLIESSFPEIDYHLFSKYYSGTYWSFEQCSWIDGIRKAADFFQNSPLYYAILSSLMHAMSYTSQSTGHYAQFRDAKTDSSMEDILLYRRKALFPLFERKLLEVFETLDGSKFNNTVTSWDYRDCLDKIPINSIVYADPPYAFVHYSRFYHVLETLVNYDYPEVEHKGRYRKERHQSPFCQRSNVKKAFEALFNKTKLKNSKLLLSYSNTGLISLEEIQGLAKNILTGYSIEAKELNHKHSTMGRNGDKSRDVQEYLIIAK